MISPVDRARRSLVDRFVRALPDGYAADRLLSFTGVRWHAIMTDAGCLFRSYSEQGVLLTRRAHRRYPEDPVSPDDFWWRAFGERIEYEVRSGDTRATVRIFSRSAWPNVVKMQPTAGATVKIRLVDTHRLAFCARVVRIALDACRVHLEQGGSMNAEVQVTFGQATEGEE